MSERAEARARKKLITATDLLLLALRRGQRVSELLALKGVLDRLE